MKFEREDTPTIMDGVVVRYKFGAFEISASRNGLMVQGGSSLIDDYGDLQMVIEYLHRAFRQHNCLSKNLHDLYSRVEPLPESVFEDTER